MSLTSEATPIIGRSKSSSRKPTPRSMARAGARPTPPVVSKLRRFFGWDMVIHELPSRHVTQALSLSVHTDTIPVRAGRIRFISPPPHPRSDPLALSPCLRFETNLSFAPHRHLLLLLHTPPFPRGQTNSFQTGASTGLATLPGTRRR